MDDRFPKFTRVIVDKLSFLSLPNLGTLIAGLAILGFVGHSILNAPMERFLFDPQAFLAGEYWRIFAFPTLTDPLWLLFFCMYVYFIFGMMESSWGEAPTTIYTLLSYLAALGASFFAGAPLSVWTSVMENISLGFGTLFPEMEFYLFFILPVKAKWLALFAGALFLYQFATGSLAMKGFLLIMLSPYLLFFGPVLYRAGRAKWKISRNRKRFGGGQ
jgi:hypothetical protein